MKDSSAERTASAGRRAAVYWFSDGLPEFVFGLALLLLGVLGFAWRSHGGGAWTTAAMWVAACGFSALFFCDRRALDFLKARVTYPRTGYVRPPEDPQPRSAGFISLAPPKPGDGNVTVFRQSTVYVFLLTAFWVHIGHRPWRVPVLMTVAALLLYILNRSEPRPYSWWAVLPIAAAGWASAWVDLPANSREFLPILIGGVWLLAQGTWTLAHYLRAHPRPPAVEAISHE